MQTETLGEGEGLAEGGAPLPGHGTEHPPGHAPLVVVEYNHHTVKLAAGLYTITRLLELFRVPSGYVLDLITPHGEFEELAVGGELRIKEHMEFISHAPCGHSS